MSIVLKIRGIIIHVIVLLVTLTSACAVSTDTAKLLYTDVYVLEDALISGQGITTDGEFYYTSGAVTSLNITAISKRSVKDGSLVKKAVNPLPALCVERGNNHIGGISYYNGKIYAPVEGEEGSGSTSCIVTFDADTLEAENVYDLPEEYFPDGVPWCAVDGNTGLLYASMWDTTKTIYVYDTQKDMAFVKAFTLSESIRRIQGGEFFDGTLYLSQDNNHNGSLRNILSVDTQTGKVSVVMERDIGSEDYEAEGMTFTKTDDGVVLSVLDYNRTVGVFLHHYEFG